MSVEAEASFGFTLMNRLATRPPSKAQSTVSPAKTLATFSSAGRTISWRSRSVERDAGQSQAGGDCDRNRWFHGISPFAGTWLHCLALGKTRDALGESVLFNEPRPTYSVLRLRRESRVAAAVEIERDNFRQPVASHV